MKRLTMNFKRIRGIGAGLMAGLILAGCASSPKGGPDQAGPVRLPGQGPVPTAPGPGSLEPISQPVVLRVGELVTVTFSDLPPPGLQDHKERIREDGKLTLPYNVTVIAAGKTPGKLQEDIRKEYVPRFYVNLTVTVKPEERFFYVGGEVKTPARQFYLGEMTVLRAVQSAGDFTDFANRKRIEVIRTNGQKITVNWYKAIKDPKLDAPVFPNDYIIVHRKSW